jgi:hypothetical protein
MEMIAVCTLDDQSVLHNVARICNTWVLARH